MYEKFFGLQNKPFDLVPNPRFLFPSKSHRKALNFLHYGLQEKAGFILLTGEIGSGKTTVIREIVNKLDSSRVLSLVFNTRVNSNQLLAMINDDFGLETEGKDKVLLLRELNDFLIKKHGENCFPVIIIDEAQNLSPDTLEEIRLLSNLEKDDCKLVQIILVGQPELKKIIAQPELEQLRQRIGIVCHLQPLNREEIEEYIFHRLEIAGNRNAVNFQEGALDIIFRLSQGIPRLINVSCDFLLLAAFVEETRELTLNLVEEVVGELAGSPREKCEVGENHSDGLPNPILNCIEKKFFLLEKKIEENTFEKSEKKQILDALSAHENSLKKMTIRNGAELFRLEGMTRNLSIKIEDLSQKVARMENTSFREGHEGKDIENRGSDERKGFWKSLW
jgi:general secretion pathway protein A